MGRRPNGLLAYSSCERANVWVADLTGHRPIRSANMRAYGLPVYWITGFYVNSSCGSAGRCSNGLPAYSPCGRMDVRAVYLTDYRSIRLADVRTVYLTGYRPIRPAGVRMYEPLFYCITALLDYRPIRPADVRVYGSST